MDTIVIVEDEEVPRELLKEILEMSYEVIPFANGEDALRYFELGGVSDLVITDMDMPKLNGVGLAKALKAMKSAIPMVICTGNNREKVPNIELFAGYIQKPFRIKELLDCVKANLV